MDVHLTLVREQIDFTTLRVVSGDGSSKDAAAPVPAAASAGAQTVGAQLEAERNDQLELSEAAVAQWRAAVAADSAAEAASARVTTVTTVSITITAETKDERDVDFSSVGDPHLSIREHGGGTDVTAKYDSQTDHTDLVSVDAIAGGYRAATVATAIGAGGVAFNAAAAVTMNGGADRVTLDKAGLTIESGGSVLSHLDLSAPIPLAGGGVVTRRADGAIMVRATAGRDDVETLLTENGNGVDVYGYTHGLAVTGDLADALAAVHPSSGSALRSSTT
jgi:hypothetical protein